MDIYGGISAKENTQPFADYTEYMDTLFAWANNCLDNYMENLKQKYAAGDGGYKNIFYPDLEIAQTLCQRKIFIPPFQEQKEKKSPLMDEILSYVNVRAKHTVTSGISLPFYELCHRLGFKNFTLFCFVLGILAATQTDYAAVFQIVNENGNLTVPTVESGAKLYFGNGFSPTEAYSHMSLCIEELSPILNLRIPEHMPFSAEISLDKRIIDFLFGKNPFQTDENYIRFFSRVPLETEAVPILANQWLLGAIETSFENNIRHYFLTGDEGSGRKFFIKKFCKNHGLGIVTLNCRKLFSHDYEFADKALWALARECILTDSCCLLEFSPDKEERESFLEYMDMALIRLAQNNIPTFSLSREKLLLGKIPENGAALHFPLPDMKEREECFKFFAQKYSLSSDIDFSQMASQFLFTPVKIKSLLNTSKIFAFMRGSNVISKNDLLSGCHGQASSDLTLKAAKIETYNGISILATNHKNSIDPAFFRRMKYVVEFQFPDAATRELLWRRTIPKDTPLGDDVDIPFLAEKFEFSGGNIKNCILNAAFLAASEEPGTKVYMRHYLKAIRYEYIKTGKIFTKADFQPYAEEVFDE